MIEKIRTFTYVKPRTERHFPKVNQGWAFRCDECGLIKTNLQEAINHKCEAKYGRTEQSNQIYAGERS